jgi:diguanylate cyclase (GGDEF)-like protein
MFAGEGSLSHLMPRSERPPGVGWVASTGRSFVTEGRSELAATLPHLAAATGASEGAATRVLLLPLNVRARVEAVVLVVYRALIAAAGAAGGHVGAGEPRRADAVEGDLERAAALVDQAGAALALVHARAEAGTDPVTGCMNHRAMRRRLHEEIGRSQRSRGMLACLLLDLDDFKQINDLHGHPAGDAVLREVARALMGEFRAFDRVARYGGDEFVAILPEADLASAAAAADRALQRLRGITLPFTPQGVAASVGVAQWRTPMGVDDLLSACDEALLRGKREGKGRVTPTLRDC